MSPAEQAAALLAVVPGLAELIDQRVATGVAEALREAGVVASPWLTVVEAAEYLHWPAERVRKLTAADAIPHRHQQGRILLHRDELDAWLEDFYEGPARGDGRR